MRKSIAKLCIITGSVLIVAALTLFGYNQWQDMQAAAASRELLQQLEAELMTHTEQPVAPPASLPSADSQMDAVAIDGQSYIGILTIPSLQLNLPVMEDWSYPKLKIAPCRFYGSVAQNNLVVMAHNYRNHFGTIHQLSAGDEVAFTDINGHVTHYAVAEKDVLDPYAANEVIAGEFDLTLFTCTYGGRTRVTVYCNRI